MWQMRSAISEDRGERGFRLNGVEQRRPKRRLLMRPNPCRKQAAEATRWRQGADSDELALTVRATVPYKEKAWRPTFGEMARCGQGKTRLEKDIRLEAICGQFAPCDGMSCRGLGVQEVDQEFDMERSRSEGHVRVGLWRIVMR